MSHFPSPWFNVMVRIFQPWFVSHEPQNSMC